LVLSTVDRALVIQTGKGSFKPDLMPLEGGLGEVATKTACNLFGFDMARMALHISAQFNMPFCGVDLGNPDSSAPRSKTPRALVEKTNHTILDFQKFENIWQHDLEETDDNNAIFRAWISAR